MIQDLFFFLKTRERYPEKQLPTLENLQVISCRTVCLFMKACILTPLYLNALNVLQVQNLDLSPLRVYVAPQAPQPPHPHQSMGPKLSCTAHA